jgi:hypothetical protein
MFNILVPFGSWYIMITSSGVDHLKTELLVCRRNSKLCFVNQMIGEEKSKVHFKISLAKNSTKGAKLCQ